MSAAQKKESGNVHPLNRSWTLWYDSSSTYNTESWGLSLVPIITVKTVEHFLLMLKYMKPLHALRMSAQYHFFQEGVKPMWEDEANKCGGRLWVNIDPNSITTNNSQTKGLLEDASVGASNMNIHAATEKEKIDLDTIWKNVLMALVGETLEDSDDPDTQIVGVVMAKRKYHNRLALWLKNGNNESAIDSIKNRLIQEAPLHGLAPLTFTKHSDLAGGKS
ncbi:unnamed protein product [Phytomonas sp. Hart1]|nr:unnamed protein product [Phytomonas sp. Hart1]|eukprot:CCW71040.1 unnamed protein product [Phytomonas sp. isolate Hart1]